MIIKDVKPNPDFTLNIVKDDGSKGIIDIKPYFKYPVFKELENYSHFQRITNGGYFIEWECGADLSADSIEANFKEINL